MQQLQAMEGYPPDTADFAMLEMFEREGWSQERCLDFIRQETLRRLGLHAAE